MTSNVLAKLKIQTPGEEERTVTLSDGQTVAVGRDEENELFINDPSVSRIHACFTATIHGVVIADLSSRNGTFLNGERVVSFRDLNSGDVIDIGSTKIKVFLNAQDDLGDTATAKRSMTAELQRVFVTVMVCSLMNFNKLENDDIESWRKNVTDTIEAMDGSIDKVVERSIIAMWIGTDPRALALNAANAGQKIRNLVTTNYAGKLDCTVVLASGAALREMNQANSHFSLLGDPINLAFKLEESISVLGQRMIIPKVTADLLKDKFPIRKIIGVKVKENEAPMDVFIPA